MPAAAVAGPGSTGNTSEGEGEEPDVEVSRELESFDVERFRRAGAHLDLMWNVEKVPAQSSRVSSPVLTCPNPYLLAISASSKDEFIFLC